MYIKFCNMYNLKVGYHITSSHDLYALFLYKNVVFPVQAEYSYFSADFRLKIFLYYS